MELIVSRRELQFTWLSSIFVVATFLAFFTSAAEAPPHNTQPPEVVDASLDKLEKWFLLTETHR